MSSSEGPKVYSLEEIKSHNTQDDLWMTIHGKVYKIGDFIHEHPGGEEVLIDVGGQDATEAFEDIGHSDDAREQLEPLEIGILDPADLSKKPAPGNTTSTSTATGTSSGASSSSILYFILAALTALGGFLYLNYAN